MYSLIPHGRRSLELLKWRHFRVSVQNAFSAFPSSLSSATAAADMMSPPQDGRKGETFTVSYLVDSLGLTRKLAESISKKVSSVSVLSRLRSHGFTDHQISTIITAYPGLLMLDAEKSLGPKLQFLQSRGASCSELTEIVSKVPKILGIEKDKAFGLYYDFVKEIIEADKSSKFKKLCFSLPQGSKQENKFRNVSALRELGVPQQLLFSLLISRCTLVCGKERFEESLKKVVEMGFDPTSSKFLQALQVVYDLSDKVIEEKVNAYKSLGFSVEDVWAIFKKCPNILTYSEEKIVSSTETFLGLGFSREESALMVKRFPQLLGSSAETVKKKTEFLVKQMNWPREAVVSHPQAFNYSMEKKILPRCSVMKALMSKGLLGNRESKLPSMEYVLKSTDEVFLQRFVRKHEDKQLVTELMAIFTKDPAS